MVPLPASHVVQRSLGRMVQQLGERPRLKNVFLWYLRVLFAFGKCVRCFFWQREGTHCQHLEAGSFTCQPTIHPRVAHPRWSGTISETVLHANQEGVGLRTKSICETSHVCMSSMKKHDGTRTSCFALPSCVCVSIEFFRRWRDYPALHAWLRDVYHLPGVAETIDIDGVRNSYFAQLL